MSRLVALTALLALAACADSEPPDPTPADDNGAYNMIDPISTEVAEDTAPAIGEWTRTMQEERPALAFGPMGAEPLFSIRCDDREGVLINRHGLVETGSAGMMTMTMGDASRELAVNPAEGPLPMLRAAVPATDPLLARLGEYEGPIRLSVGDGPPLVLPSSPMIGEFIRNCAAGEIPPVGAAAGANATAPEIEGSEAGNSAAPATDTP